MDRRIAVSLVVAAVALTPAAVASHGAWSRSGAGAGAGPATREDPCATSQPVSSGIGSDVHQIPGTFADGSHTLTVDTSATLRVDVFFLDTDDGCQELGSGACALAIGCDRVQTTIPADADFVEIVFTGAGFYDAVIQ